LGISTSCRGYFLSLALQAFSLGSDDLTFTYKGVKF